MPSLWKLFFIFGTLGYVHSACTVTPLFSETTTLGRKEEYCVYNVTQGNISIPINIMLGSKVEFRDTCKRCQCTSLGMSCCGFGVYGEGSIHVPQGCIAIPDGCNVAIVSLYDNRTDCFGPMGPIGRQRQQQHYMENAMRGYLRHENPAAMNYLDTKPFRGPNAGGMGPGGAQSGEAAAPQPDGLLETMLMLNMVGAGPSLGAMGGMGGMGGGFGGGFGNLFGGPLGFGLMSLMS